MYSDLTELRYTLLTVMIHDGGPTSGHYYAYIRDPNTEQWMMYNDRHVSEAKEEEIMVDARGGDGSSSAAYCLVYVDPNRINVAGSCSCSCSCVCGLISLPPLTACLLLAPDDVSRGIGGGVTICRLQRVPCAGQAAGSRAQPRRGGPAQVRGGEEKGFLAFFFSFFFLSGSFLFFFLLRPLPLLLLPSWFFSSSPFLL